MKLCYDANYISAFYDAYGSKEWGRLVRTPADRVSFHIHKHYLSQYVRTGDRVLEAGAGPGRFTIELAHLAARVTVGDISAKQLELNKQNVVEAGLNGAVESRVKLNITDLSEFETSSFDAVVCYGGPLSYTLDRADDAARELIRIVKPRGYVLLSVTSLIGATRTFFEGILKLDKYPELVDSVNCDGVLTREHNNDHPMKLYRSVELRELLERCGCTVVAASAANLISAGREELLSSLIDTPTWERFLAWELEYCAESGAVDCGTHILMVAQKNDGGLA